MITEQSLATAITTNVAAALAEDIGSGDITAQLIAPETRAQAYVIARESAVLCGTAWVERVFRSLDAEVRLDWRARDGDELTPEQPLLRLEGNARALLTGERSALNFLQSLSGTATTCKLYSRLVEGTGAKLLDTRKTIPGLRIAQKYAVTQGGCFNHRLGLYDAFLIKENHILACGSIANAIQSARQLAADKPVEVEVENMNEFEQALAAGADIIMLDNFKLEDMRRAVVINKAREPGLQAKLEASGGIGRENLRAVAGTGVDYISIGALTKDCRAIDLSMRFDTPRG